MGDCGLLVLRRYDVPGRTNDWYIHFRSSAQLSKFNTPFQVRPPPPSTLRCHCAVPRRLQLSA